ncbi:MAG TPA: type III pantothenate kinase [Terrimicrobiaceae bacterium]|nr:type III pantothenate kinase [Terrimicrobiaceae bacterium]
MRGAEFVLVDISNSFTKVAFSSRTRLGRSFRLPTGDLSAGSLRRLLKGREGKYTVAASVVPSRNPAVAKALPGPLCWVGHRIPLGVGIDYPKPETIGADRLANAAAAVALYGSPAIVVDFGTAVTFDVIAPPGTYVGGVIAPGLNAMTDYLHRRTALLPRVSLREPRQAIGRSTAEAMRSGAIYGYRGLVSEILRQLLKEIPSKSRKPLIIATGGDARLIAGSTKLFSAVSPSLTLEGLRLIGCLNFPA